ncbi:glycosyltransferase [Elusimicrobiota bacterium]
MGTSKRKRVLMVLPSLEGGGSERVISTLLRYIDRDRFHVGLALENACGPYKSDVPEDITVFDLGAKRTRNAILSLIKLIRRFDPDVVLSTIGQVNLLLLGIRFLTGGKYRLLIRETNTPSVNLNTTYNPWMFRTLYRWLYPKADRIICSCEVMREDLEKHFAVPGVKIIVIPNPVDRDYVLAQASNREHGFEPGRINLVAAGRLVKQKGFDILIKAFSMVKDRYPDANLTILGEGPEKESLKQLACAGKVDTSLRFAGFKRNPYAYLSEADVFVLSSRWEGLPNAALEALACDTPVVAFAGAGGISEVIKDGFNGMIAAHEDAGDLAGKICSMLNRKNNHSVNLLPEKFRVENVVKQYENILN